MKAVQEFADAMRAAGVGVPKLGIVPDGKIHRFRGIGDSPGRRNAWYLLHLDGRPAGRFGSWRTGISAKWSNDHTCLSAAEREEWECKLHQEVRRAQLARACAQREAAQSARRRWDAAQGADPNHSYLLAKRISPGDLRQQGSYLLAPVRDIDFELCSLQTIAPDGTKLFISGGRIGGCFCPIGVDMDVPTRLLICEGYATGATLYEETGIPVLCALSSGNLMRVAQAARRKWPNCAITICGDDDRTAAGNPGRTQATYAAAAIDADVAFPIFAPGEKGKDFNDMAAARQRAGE